MGKRPLQYNKKYKLKIGTKKVDLFLENIESVLDASCLEKSNSRKEIHRHEVAHCIFKTTSPFSFDLVDETKTTSRFVIVDGYDIAGGGIIVEALEQTNTSNDEKGPPDLAAFEIELKNLIVKYFPHWDINI